MKVLLDIDPAYEPSIGAAMNDYNAGLPATVSVDAQGNPLAPGQTLPNPALATSKESFIQQKAREMLKGFVAKYGVLPPPVVVDGVPQEVSARQAYEELIAQGLHNDLDASLSEVEKCIALISDLAVRTRVRNLWRKSTVFQRQQPELVTLWMGAAPGGLGKTAADLDQTFISASNR